MATPTKRQVIKSIVFAALGATPGIVWYVLTRMNEALIVTAFGAFIGFAFSLPGVSLKRVAAGTAGAIIANNAPVGMQSRTFEKFIDEDSDEADADAEAK